MIVSRHLFRRLGQVPMIWIGGSLEKSRTQASIRLLRLIPVP
jgi:hypothetical protein